MSTSTGYPQTPSTAMINGNDASEHGFVSVPNTPALPQSSGITHDVYTAAFDEQTEEQRYYDEIALHSHSSYSILKENFEFWLQQTWRTRLGCRFVILIASTGVVAGSMFVLNTYNNTRGQLENGNKGGLWRDGEGQGGIDMSPVTAMLIMGSVVVGFNFLLIVASWLPATRPINTLSDMLNLTLSTIAFIGSITAVVYSFIHPSLNVDFDSPSPISFRKYACNIEPKLLQDAAGKPVTGDPLRGVDSRALVLFASMCGQFNLTWVLALVVLFFETLILITIPLGRRWRKGLEEVERGEEKLSGAGKYQG
ncbi:hypothetical protein BDZ91DRAFT_763430 [Kalaharituber pfeilii]|nr:hypothetical protein BDZ91DRAFT_763430 [Kalaharituber pfeilii]